MALECKLFLFAFPQYLSPKKAQFRQFLYAEGYIVRLQEGLLFHWNSSFEGCWYNGRINLELGPFLGPSFSFPSLAFLLLASFGTLLTLEVTSARLASSFPWDSGGMPAGLASNPSWDSKEGCWGTYWVHKCSLQGSISTLVLAIGGGQT